MAAINAIKKLSTNTEMQNVLLRLMLVAISHCEMQNFIINFMKLYRKH